MALHGDPAALTCRTLRRTANHTRGGKREPLCPGPRQRAHTATRLGIDRAGRGLIDEKGPHCRKMALPTHPPLAQRSGRGKTSRSSKLLKTKTLWLAHLNQQDKSASVQPQMSPTDPPCAGKYHTLCAPSHCMFTQTINYFLGDTLRVTK